MYIFTCQRALLQLHGQKEECSLLQKCQNVWRAISLERQRNGWGQSGPSVKCWTVPSQSSRKQILTASLLLFHLFQMTQSSCHAVQCNRTLPWIDFFNSNIRILYSCIVKKKKVFLSIPMKQLLFWMVVHIELQLKKWQLEKMVKAKYICVL